MYPIITYQAWLSTLIKLTESQIQGTVRRGGKIVEAGFGRVVYPRVADNVLRSLLCRLCRVNQPVVRSRNVFLAPR